MKTKKGIQLICKKCKHEWEYKGKKKFNKNFSQYVSCPTCLTKVRLEEAKKKR